MGQNPRVAARMEAQIAEKSAAARTAGAEGDAAPTPTPGLAKGEASSVRTHVVAEDVAQVS
jgi:hypothetical protein